MEGVGTEYDETNARHVISSKSGEGYAIFGAGCRGVRVSFEVEVWSALFAGSEAFGDKPLSIIVFLASEPDDGALLASQDIFKFALAGNVLTGEGEETFSEDDITLCKVILYLCGWRDGCRTLSLCVVVLSKKPAVGRNT